MSSYIRTIKISGILEKKIKKNFKTETHENEEGRRRKKTRVEIENNKKWNYLKDTKMVVISHEGGHGGRRRKKGEAMEEREEERRWKKKRQERREGGEKFEKKKREKRVKVV